MSDGIEVCVTATIIDGLVLARSAFHHSMNYRSVVILGRATPVTDDDEKTRALEATMDRLLAGRWADARQPNEKELAQTLMVSLPIDEASAKVRTNPPSTPSFVAQKQQAREAAGGGRNAAALSSPQCFFLEYP